jgi:hypothetical protein
MHQEMPRGDDKGRMHGFQLWANLPSSLKMTKPRYQDIESAHIPEVVEDDGTRVRVVCGEFWGTRGPVDGIAADPYYLDIWVPPNVKRSFPVDTRRHAFAYIFEGSGTFRDASKPFGVLTEKSGPVETVAREMTGNRSLVLFDAGDEVTGAGGRGRDPLPARLRSAAEGTRGLVRSDRDEHRGRAAPGGSGPSRRNVHSGTIRSGGAQLVAPEIMPTTIFLAGCPEWRPDSPGRTAQPGCYR